MNTPPEPPHRGDRLLRLGLVLIGASLFVERVGPAGPLVGPACGLGLLVGFLLLASRIGTLGRGPASPPAPPPNVPGVDPIRARLDAARRVGDPALVLDLRDELAPKLGPEERQALDRETLTWLMTVLQRRLRGGAAARDVADLAARAADRFGDTVEGASLRASLPTLRRAAGLCPQCGQALTPAAVVCPGCAARIAP